MTTLKEQQPHFSSRIDRLESSDIREILALTQQKEMISFAGGLPDESLMETLPLAARTMQSLQYGPSEGELHLRDWVSGYLKRLGIQCCTEQVMITSGSQQGLDLVAKLFIDPDTAIAIESPTYLAALQAFQLFGAKCLPLPLTADGINPSQLDSILKKHRPKFLYLIPTFQNPSGTCYSTRARQEIAEVLDKHSACLVEDDPYRELNYGDTEEKPICSYLTKAPWIYLGSFSKTLQPGLRIGYLTCSKSFFPHLLRLKQATDLHSNRLGQHLIADIIQSNAYHEHIRKLRQHYEAKRNAMGYALHRHWTDIAVWNTPRGGLFYWIKMKERISTRDYLRKATEEGVAFIPGDAFFPNGRENCSFLRLNFSHPSKEDIETGIARLAAVFKTT